MSVGPLLSGLGVFHLQARYNAPGVMSKVEPSAHIAVICLLSPQSPALPRTAAGSSEVVRYCLLP